MSIEINGMAHVVLTVSDFRRARAFYARLLPAFGMKPVFDGPKFAYFVGARTAIGIEPCDPAYQGERFVQQRVGLHHLCLRARSREDVDRAATLLREMDATIIRASAGEAGRRATIPCCSRIRTASGWRSISCRGPACWRRAPSSTPRTATPAASVPPGDISLP